ncbi:MAG: hypothetical protein VW397_03600, partial [Candidatus Margulisiibacteriota bacterium]
MEAPNEIKFQSPITSFGQGGILTNSGPIFESIFNLESQKFQSRSTEYQPPSPKNGVTWLELNNQTPFK